MCGATGELSVHHIIERRLFSDFGYYMDNGATLCEEHHIEAETTELDCDTIRATLGITKPVIPDTYYPDHEYTKWGDVILSDGKRMKGPLFDDDSVQKILKKGPHYHLYTEYVKYPRTMHLPWSQGKTKDDKTLKDCSHFIGKDIVVTEKMDGENTTIYRDYIHARSIDGRNHPSRNWVKNLQAQIGYELPEGWRICGENLFAEHNIRYDNLDSYFYVFSIWNEQNVCLSWDETVDYCDILGLQMVPVLYRGEFRDEDPIKELYNEKMRDTREGYVMRVSDAFPYIAFPQSVAKFVRKDHVRPENHHWMFQQIKPNGLKE